MGQGGAMALYTSLQLQAPPAGILVMSGYLPNQAKVAKAPGLEAMADVPVLLCHGTHDMMVDPSAAKSTKRALEDFGLKHVELREYEGMGHAVDDEELDD